MARPTSRSDGAARTINLMVCLAPSEHEQLKKLAASRNMSMGAFVREIVFNRRMPPPQRSCSIPAEAEAIYYELREAVNSINQLIKNANLAIQIGQINGIDINSENNFQRLSELQLVLKQTAIQLLSAYDNQTKPK